MRGLLTRRRCRNGASLIELIVAMFIVGLMMLEIWKLVAAGAQFYKRARGQSEIQRNSLLALRWIAKDLAEGSTISFRNYQTENAQGVSTGFTHAGLVFGSPSEAGTGSVRYDDTGHMRWCSIIGYYIEPTDGGLYRQQIPIADPKTFPPVIDNDQHSTDIMAALPRPRLVARGIKEIATIQGPKDIQVELSTREETLGFGIKVKTRLEMKN